MHGKNINLFLMDGEVSGRIKCTLANWTGVAYKIPRVDLDLCKQRSDLKQSGVYFLFGIYDINSENVVYVGQAGARNSGEGLLYRLQEHRRDPKKDYWSEAIVLTTSNNSFGPTEISYLENRFCELAKNTHRYTVKNADEPNHGNVTEEKESELEEFIEYAKIVVGVLGHKIFEPLTNINITHKNIEEQNNELNIEGDRTVYFLMRRGANAQAVQTADGFVLLSGSVLSKEPVKSCSKRYIKMREQYKQYIDSNMKTTRDIYFKSPSGAACFVLLSSANGCIEWKTSSGTTLQDMEIYY